MATENSAQSLDIRVDQTKIERFINQYKKHLIIAFAAIVAIVLAFWGAKIWHNNREEAGQAQLDLGQAYIQQIYQANPDSTAAIKKACELALKGDAQKKDGFKGFLKIASDYKWTNAANIAHLYAGICYYHEGDYKKAIDELKSFSPQDDATISANALNVLGDCYAADKQTDKAIDCYKDAAKKAGNASLSPRYLMNAAMLYEETGKKAEANKIYVQIKNDYPDCPLCTTEVQGDMVNGPEIDKYIERTK